MITIGLLCGLQDSSMIPLFLMCSNSTHTGSNRCWEKCHQCSWTTQLGGVKVSNFVLYSLVPSLASQ